MDLREPYEGAVCVVTGATSGNGEAVARELVRLGAEVHVLGRNIKKLREWEGLARAHQVNLADMEDLGTTLGHLPNRVDFIFHLAGNAAVGRLSEEQVHRLWRSDYTGPIQLIEHLIPRMSPGGKVGIVTSASVALGSLPEITHYQAVKREMFHWWRRNQEWAEDTFKVNLTLISMGAINTSIWDRAEGMSRVTAGVVKLIIPGPRHYAKQILEDVALGKPVSYPGVGASLAPIVNGEYQPHPWVKRAATWGTKTWFQMFPAKEVKP